MLVRANANRRNKHSTPGLSTMNISPFSKAEILRLLIFYDAYVWFCNVISYSIRVLWIFYFIGYFVQKWITQNLRIFHLASFPLLEVISAFSLVIVLLLRLVLDIDAWKWHWDTRARCRQSGILRNIRCPPLTLSVAACLSHVRRHPIRFTLSCDGLVLHGILYSARIQLREALRANIGRDTNK